MRKLMSSPILTLAFALALGVFAGPSLGLLSARAILASSSGGGTDGDCG